MLPRAPHHAVRRALLRVLLVGVPTVLALAPRPAAAEGGALRGVVLDAQTGKATAGALVVIQCVCLQGQREVLTNNDGLYNFEDLPPGLYTVQALYQDGNVSKVAAHGIDARIKSSGRPAK